MITFSITVESTVTPEAICENLFDVAQWTSFHGYGPVPGIVKATTKAPGNPIVGTVIDVENRDGSRHIETIESFDPGISLVMRISDFTPPLRNLATHFIERWDFSMGDVTYRIKRTFELYPKSALTSPLLWLLSRFLQKAVKIHTYQLANPAKT